MEAEPITLDRQHQLTALLEGCRTGLSEYSFAGIYLFRGTYRYGVIQHEGELLISGVMREGKSFLMPTRPPDAAWVMRCTSLLAAGACFYPIPEAWLGAFAPAHFHREFQEKQSDYIYSTEKMSTLPGRHLSSKRNLIHQFLGNYEVKFKLLTKSNVGDGLNLLDCWKQELEPEEAKTTASPRDCAECEEALQLCEQLKLQGVILYADDKPVGMALGKALSDEMFDMHFAKALRSYKGAYQYLFELFAQQVLENFQPGSLWLNLEHSVGQPNLAHAKHSYHPDILAKKWRLTPFS